ncbi:MAG: DNA-directed RNA polymerase subunit B, partial [archaeon]
MAEVYLNGCFVGSADNGKQFAENVIAERRKGALSSNLNVHFNEDTDEIRLESSKGRIRRPFIVVQSGQPMLTEAHIRQLEKKEIVWSDLIKGGIIEYLDAAEEENTLIAFSEEDITLDHTHLEIMPLTMMGLIASLVPFGNYTSPARLCIGAKNQ